MSKKSRLKHVAKKRKKKGPGPGDKPRRTSPETDTSVYNATDNIPIKELKEPVKSIDKGRNEAPVHQPTQKRGHRGS